MVHKKSDQKDALAGKQLELLGAPATVPPVASEASRLLRSPGELGKTPGCHREGAAGLC